MSESHEDFGLIVGKISGKLDQMAETMESMQHTLMEVHKNHGVTNALTRGQSELFKRVKDLEERVNRGEKDIEVTLQHVRHDKSLDSWLGEKAVLIVVGIIMFVVGWILSSLPEFHEILKLMVKP